jgi:hypothetical protein
MSHINNDLKVNISGTCLTPSLNLTIRTEKRFEALVFGPLLLQMIAQDQLNEHVEHERLTLVRGFSCFIVFSHNYGDITLK